MKQFIKALCEVHFLYSMCNIEGFYDADLTTNNPTTNKIIKFIKKYNLIF